MKPEWKNAPAWANYLAADVDGAWYWFEDRPIPGIVAWRNSTHDGRFVEACTTNEYWKDSLEARPNEA